VTRLLELRLDITGVENIAARQRYVVVALHEGFADAVALYVCRWRSGSR
jgi:1-acyl-sn-glycerol-3-phosphate acyltransferase